MRYCIYLQSFSLLAVDRVGINRDLKALIIIVQTLVSCLEQLLTVRRRSLRTLNILTLRVTQPNYSGGKMLTNK